MKKSILNLAGAQELSKNEQIVVNGGKNPPTACSNGTYPVTRDACLCLSPGHYNTSTSTCSNNAPTFKVWEIATGCCFSSGGMLEG